MCNIALNYSWSLKTIIQNLFCDLYTILGKKNAILIQNALTYFFMWYVMISSRLPRWICQSFYRKPELRMTEIEISQTPGFILSEGLVVWGLDETSSPALILYYDKWTLMECFEYEEVQKVEITRNGDLFTSLDTMEYLSYCKITYFLVNLDKHYILFNIWP